KICESPALPRVYGLHSAGAPRGRIRARARRVAAGCEGARGSDLRQSGGVAVASVWFAAHFARHQAGHAGEPGTPGDSLCVGEARKFFHTVWAELRGMAGAGERRSIAAGAAATSGQ